MLFLSASRVIQNLLSSMQYPRDQRLVTELAKFNIQITELIDQITLNADENDLTLSALRELAKNQPAWPTLVRPGDDKFTATKIEKLNVGSKAPVRLLSRNAKRYPSLKTPRNRLVLGLIGGIRKYTKTILLTRRKGGPVQHCRPKEAR